MKFSQVNATIEEICKNSSLNFVGKCIEIEKRFNSCNEGEILNHIYNAGVIPECIDHDSTEEKLFAKYCDALLANALRTLGLEAKTIPERGDAADVYAKNDKYSLVGDAKAFRLSRTAKNQKDFKVVPLNEWRNNAKADFSCLVSPLYQYPSSNSQIYQQATKYNVTLLSYTHLAFLLEHKNIIKKNNQLEILWGIPKSLANAKSANDYWNAIDHTMLKLVGGKTDDWKKFVSDQMKLLPKKGHEQINYWEGEKEKINKFSHEKAVKELLKALKIEAKIETIKKSTGIES